MSFSVKENKFLKEKYYYIKHKSGLDIYVLPKKMSTTFALFGTRYGSNDNIFKLEGDADFTTVPNGIAHFLEHKMFENEDGVDTFERFVKLGASANAFTSHTMTAYLFSATDNAPQSLRVLLDFVTKPYFTKETVAKEQGIIGQEIEMYLDNPGTRLYYGLAETMYENNPTRIDIAGSVESISHITDKILYKCYDTFYSLSNMMLSVCGDITPEEVLAAADEILPVKEGKKIIRKYPDEPREVFKKYGERKMQVSKPQVAIGIKDCDIDIPAFEKMRKTAGMEIIGNALFGESSEFHKKLYDAGIISQPVGFGYELTPSCAFAMLDTESANPEAVKAEFDRTVAEAIEKGIDSKIAERYRRISLADFVKRLDSTEDIAYYMMSMNFIGCDLFDYPDAVLAADDEYLSQLLKTMFDGKFVSMFVINPTEEEK